VAVVGTVLLCIIIGFIPLVIAWLMGTIFGVIAGIKANEGSLYKYPMAPNIIK
ncbi:DUF4870 domain-containing protein, partial [Allorhizocola rhizosphaerae]|uniref:DUF4870 domain-containing protein n=1 Tax=Allorhizocola rhizosphaerae TaxID=1872709 RepID=UPI0013C2F452